MNRCDELDEVKNQVTKTEFIGLSSNVRGSGNRPPAESDYPDRKSSIDKEERQFPRRVKTNE